MQKVASQAFFPLLLAAVGLGAVQSLLRVAFPASTVVSLLDDSAILLAGLALLIGRWARVPRYAWLALFAWGALTAIAIARSTIAFSFTIEAARQIALPAALVVMGIALTKREWRVLAALAVGIAAANGLYAVVEMTVGRFIDPAVMARTKDWMPDGLPASYFWYDADANRLPRAGGLVLNPPIAGIVIAAGLVLAWFLARKWWHYALAALFVVPLYLTYSRAGLVIAGIGIVLPLALRYLGYAAAVLLGLFASVPIFLHFSAQGKTVVHVHGLVDAFLGLVEHPFGAGIGHFGNVALRGGGEAAGGESLGGLMVSALGIPGLLIILSLVVSLVWSMLRGTAFLYPAALGAGLLVTAFVSESAGALNGTIPLWAAIGAAIAHSDESQRCGALPSWLMASIARRGSARAGSSSPEFGGPASLPHRAYRETSREISGEEP